MMVRLDKILHMITRFKAEFKGLEQNQYAQPPHGIKISNKSFIIFKRMGVIGRDKTLSSIEKEIITSIPYGREEFLFLYLDKLFDNFSELRKNPDLPLQLAAELGLDVQQLKADFNSSEVRDFVKAEKDQFSALRNQGMERMGIPKFFSQLNKPTLQLTIWLISPLTSINPFFSLIAIFSKIIFL